MFQSKKNQLLFFFFLSEGWGAGEGWLELVSMQSAPRGSEVMATNNCVWPLDKSSYYLQVDNFIHGRRRNTRCAALRKSALRSYDGIQYKQKRGGGGGGGGGGRGVVPVPNSPYGLSVWK